jgi:hypothetical protein
VIVGTNQTDVVRRIFKCLMETCLNIDNVTRSFIVSSRRLICFQRRRRRKVTSRAINKKTWMSSRAAQIFLIVFFFNPLSSNPSTDSGDQDDYNNEKGHQARSSSETMPHKRTMIC